MEPHTVGQYTGIKDKKGTRIFEGDIIRAGKYIYAVKIGPCSPKPVEFYCDFHGRARAIVYSVYAETGGKQFILAVNNGLKYEIIGNIYDNHELLEEKNDGT